jgi:uncharacterized MAPEG superfamily protein
MFQFVDSAALSAYALSVILLFCKFFFTISVQAKERLGARTFRHPEDAAFWKGTVREDSDLTQRAQHLLRNDGESQPYYLALGALYVAVGAWPDGAPFYFCGYVLSRFAHAYFFLKARQPHRNRAFALGILLLFIIAGHVVASGCCRLCN